MLAFKAPENASARAKVLLIGSAGVGKTHAALTFPKPAVIDAEGSVGWFKDRFQFDAVATKSYSDVRDLIRDVRSNKAGYETVVIDSLTTIYNGLINVASKDRDDLRPLDWGRIKRKFSQLLDELYYQLPMHVVCIGWIKAEYAKAGTVVNGKAVTAQDMITIGEGFDGDKKTEHAFDFIFKIDGNDGKNTRATVLKSRSGMFTKGAVIPSFSWATLAPLFEGRTDTAKRGMTDAEQVSYDADALGDALPSNKQIFQRALEQGVATNAATFWEWASVAADVQRGNGLLDEHAKRAVLRALAEGSDSATPVNRDVIEDAQPIAPPLPKALLDAGNALGILPLGIHADLKKNGGDVTALLAQYTERAAARQPRGGKTAAPSTLVPIAQTLSAQEQSLKDDIDSFAPKSAAPTPGEIERLKKAQQRARMSFDTELAKKSFASREERLAFATWALGRKEPLASFTQLANVSECEVVTRALAKRLAEVSNAQPNAEKVDCPCCGSGAGAAHFDGCELAA